MNRNCIMIVIAGALALIGLAAVPAIQAARPIQPQPANIASPGASVSSGPLSSWSAYQPGAAISPAAAGVSYAPANIAPAFSGPRSTWSAYQPIK